LASWATHLPVWLVWTVLGLAILSGAVLTVGIVAARISQRAWVPILPALALLTGTLAIQTTDYWYTALQHHAVLWAPYASIFTLNGEVAGICIGAITLALLVDALYKQDQSHPHRTPRAEILTAALLVGLLANIQTYTFFSITLVIAIFVTARDLTRHPSHARAYLTIALGMTVLVFGKAIASITGPLPLLVLLLLAMSPVLIPAALRAKAVAIPALVIMALAASPEVVHTALGVLNKDPFLSYREASSQGLGIVEPATLVASTAWILLFITVSLGLWRSRQATLSAMTIALGLGFVIMPANDLWGFNQEPYRSWVQFAILSSLILMIPLAWSLTQLRRWNKEHRVVFAVAATLTILVWAIGLQDFRGFWKFAHDQGITELDGARAQALAALTSTTDGIMLSSRCIDPQIFKLVTKKPVAYYNLGLAWPANEKLYITFRDLAGRHQEDPEALRDAKVRWAVTDSACEEDWNFPKDNRITLAGARNYESASGPQNLLLWQVNPR
ncbi:MAG: hypothetical protein Q8L05_01375, partial [Actinomycetota bacterium]|nr:hypothetical protein [Actinomycetota bacterium]